MGYHTLVLRFNILSGLHVADGSPGVSSTTLGHNVTMGDTPGRLPRKGKVPGLARLPGSDSAGYYIRCNNYLSR